MNDSKEYVGYADSYVSVKRGPDVWVWGQYCDLPMFPRGHKFTVREIVLECKKLDFVLIEAPNLLVTETRSEE